MTRPVTALFAASEALLVIASGVIPTLVVLTALWGAQFGFSVDWRVFWRAAVDIWLLGHGTDLNLVPDASLELGSQEPFTITIAILGIGLLTLLLAVRVGRRIAATRYRRIAEVIAVTTFAATSAALALTAVDAAARPSLWQGVALPTGVFIAGLAIGVHRSSAESPRYPWTEWIRGLSLQNRLSLDAALRGGAAAVALLLMLAAVVAAAAMVASYSRIIALYESLHTEVVGGIAVTAGEVVFAPNLVVWVASWLVGPGFALGTGSTVSPLATELGPIPAIPVLGALPVGQLEFGYLGLLAPVIAGFLAGALLAPRLRAQLTGIRLIIVGLGIGIVGGLLLGMLAWWSGGAAGPGRLEQVGPEPWAVAGWAAVELGVAATIGLLAGIRRPQRPGRAPR